MTKGYKALVSAYYQVLVAPADQRDTHLKEALQLTSDMDHKEVKQAMQEAAVMSVLDSELTA